MQEQADAEWERYLVSVRLTCITGLKKTVPIPRNDFHILELDELYWFIGKKSNNKTQENTYVMTMVSRSPRQIVGFVACRIKSYNLTRQATNRRSEFKKLLIAVRKQNIIAQTAISAILISFIQAGI